TKGTLIGVYDIRHRSGGDLPGDIDVGMSRSTDGGQTWEPMDVIMDMGNDPNFRYDGIGDPAVLVDQNTGTIWVAATWSHGNRSWRGSGPGMTPQETGQLMLVRSDDDGVTWSKPINITKQIKKPSWCFILQGPGKGITMRDGTLVFAAQYQDPPEQKRLPHSTIIYSKDHGQTWHVGTGAFDDTTESQVVEIEPGVLMLNCRYNRKPARVVMTTHDMGKTWQKHTTSERSLIEPGSCMASLIDVDREVGKDVGGWLLFSNPDSTKGRHHITIKASPDRGLTWPKANRLLLDEGTGAGYSCLSMIDDKTVGILYEGSQAHMTFQRIPLKNLVGEPVIPPKASKESLWLPQVFGSHMVLQADAAIPVWGRAKSNAQVTVTLGNDSQRTMANERGEWQIRLKSRTPSNNPEIMVVQSGDKQIAFTDVLIGEVWVCAGQSNMEWPLGQSTHGNEELSAEAYSGLRLLSLPGGARGSSGSYTSQHLARLTPETFCDGKWAAASAESGRNFSAVAWYFGRTLQEELNVPVGLICPAVGGTPTEAWIPRAALEADPALKGLVAGNWLDNDRLGEFCRTRGEKNLLQAIQAGDMIPEDDLGPNHSFKPGFMWSAGIAPLIPYAIRGAIWYQGESNAETPARVREHGHLLPLLITEWRTQWAQGDFPFLYVQLPALNRPEWPWFREGQRRLLSQLDNVGMAVTIDTGLPTNVHPPLKKPVGERLAQWALGTTYHQTSHATYRGPSVDDTDRDGHTITLSFKHVGAGLKSSDGRPLRHFEICGHDGVFHAATARITG
ncbi:MAG: exo-alpha-sialidase, partial [Phycisphaeraceae bacterium]|nr:exo-alpha-sialidase [Phycisphaeraceae bacterium]